MADIIIRRDGSLPQAVKWRYRDQGEGVYTPERHIPNEVRTIQTNGAPAAYTGLTSNGGGFFIAKGQLNKLRLRPQILNEHAESSREIQGTIDSSTIVGQIFKASQDNINGLMVTLETGGETTIDDFESYANSAALQAVWVKGGTNEALLETTIVEAGSQSMNLPLDVLNDDWVNTVGSTNYTGSAFIFDFYQNVAFSAAKVSFFIGDGTNTKSLQTVMNVVNQWQQFEINESAMAEDGAGTTDITAITKIGFRVDDQRANADGYVDNLAAMPTPGSVTLKLWDMGTSIPVSATTSIDDGTQNTQLGDIGFGAPGAGSITLTLQSGKRLYVIKDFVTGVAQEIPSNTLLTVDNYYMVTLNYVDTDVSVYGPDTTLAINYYSNGYAFTAPDEATAITAGGANSDLMFGVFSTQAVYVVGFLQTIDAAPGANAAVNIFVEDLDMVITNVTVVGAAAIQTVQADLSLRPFLLGKGGKFELYYNDDFTDSVAAIGLTIAYLHVPPTVNG